MKTLLKMSLLALTISIFAAGCSGCGDRAKPVEKIDTNKTPVNSTNKPIDTTKEN